MQPEPFPPHTAPVSVILTKVRIQSREGRASVTSNADVHQDDETRKWYENV